MPTLTEVWNTVKPLWEPAKALYQNVSGLASLLALPTVSKYLYDRWKKKRQMPELACNIVLDNSTTTPQGTLIESILGFHGVEFIPDGTSKIQQQCTFKISNVSEHIALKLRITNKDIVEWDFPLDSTKVLKGYENLSLNILPHAIVNNDAASLINSNKAFLINELIIEYRNTSGNKFQLTFKPNEKDMDKRNVCKRV